ncbi:alpha/beta fold hydrolase [Streptosporangium sp. OZ121]|uniref:alpha/beta fold hydrolase n=1 Tax=Streptosporangium sp. OZ121 TaxID=3444183 RepID=UPI003F7B225B
MNVPQVSRPPGATGNEKIVQVNGVDLCTETFGDPADPAVLLVGASMLTWEDAFCERLAAGGRFVIRYDIRDTGRSTGYQPGAPGYTLRDLVADAAGLLDALGLARAHLVTFSVGGWIGQLLALDHPGRVASLTLISTRPTAPGPSDPDLPEHSPEFMAGFMAAAEPDWADRAAVIRYLVEGGRRYAGSHPFDEVARRDLAGRVFDRTVNVRASLTSIAFIDHGDRWRERLPQIGAATLVIHGTEDPFFPYGNALALAEEIPGAELLPLERTGHELPRVVWDVVVPAVLRHTSDGRPDDRAGR